jgi:hypothetical protein
MKVIAQIFVNNNRSLFFNNRLLNKIPFKSKSNTINKSENNQKKIFDEVPSEEFFIQTLDLDNSNNSPDIFEDIKKKENLSIPKIKNEDKYERVSNLKAYQIANNKMIIDAINRNRDIKRIISDKTDCSDDNLIGFGEGIWDNNIEKANAGSDQDEMDDNKIEELINYVKKSNLEEMAKFRTKELNEMSNKEYKSYIIDVLSFLQLNINQNIVNKANNNLNNNEIKKEINVGLEKKFNHESRRIDKYFLEKQTNKRIIFGQMKEFNAEELEEIVEYLNEESRIDFRNFNDDDPEIVHKNIPQSQKARKKFKQIIDLKSEVILV